MNDTISIKMTAPLEEIIGWTNHIVPNAAMIHWNRKKQRESEEEREIGVIGDAHVIYEVG